MSVLDELLKLNTLTLAYNEKLRIIENGRPCPELPKLTSKHKQKTGTYTRRFSTNQYEIIDWLTGCELRNKLFCWPCILFSREITSWNKGGFNDLNRLSNAVQRHTASKSHIQACLQLKVFGKVRVDVVINDQPGKTINQHNEVVKKNRDLLKRLIDAICFLAKQGIPFQTENHDTSNKGNYLEFLDALKQYDPTLEHHLQDSTIFGGNIECDPLEHDAPTSAFTVDSHELQSNLVQAISELLTDEIKKEIQAASFASILLEKNSSVFLRYVFSGVLYERFVGITEDKTLEGLFKQVVATVENYNLREKLVAQAYDGASVMPGYLNLLEKKVQAVYPSACYSHCYAHALNLNLQQSLSCIKACNKFFNTLNGLSQFFSAPSKVKALEQFLYQKLSTDGKWDFTQRLIVHTVNDHCLEIVAFFESLVDTYGDCDIDTMVKSQGFLAFLKNPDTIFLLNVFSKLFTYTDVSYESPQTRILDIPKCCSGLEKIKMKLKQERDTTDFDDNWYVALGMRKQEVEPPVNKKRRGGTDACQQLYFQIIDNILEHLETRQVSLKRLDYFHLLHEQHFASYNQTVPEEYTHKLQELYGKSFDYIRLKNELLVVYTSEEFTNIMGVNELMQFLMENELTTSFKEVMKLIELILTIPATAIPAEKSCSSLKRVHSLNRSAQEARPFSLSMLFIEKELLAKIRRKVTFYDDVIEKFLQKNSIVDLIYK